MIVPLVALSFCTSVMASPFIVLPVIPAPASAKLDIAIGSASSPTKGLAPPSAHELAAVVASPASASISFTPSPSTVPDLLALTPNSTNITPSLVSTATAVTQQAASVLSYIGAVTSILSLIATELVENYIPVQIVDRTNRATTALTAGIGNLSVVVAGLGANSTNGAGGVGPVDAGFLAQYVVMFAGQVSQIGQQFVLLENSTDSFRTAFQSSLGNLSSAIQNFTLIYAGFSAMTLAGSASLFNETAAAFS
ncbi:Glycosyltransferase family 32 protein [Mycena kentingensis (nom. inval.)]|nr:Glycosyltransferase family 32 protein [Mycena kentingensis (nom. inval.)]